jgi:hypothetical protein
MFQPNLNYIFLVQPALPNVTVGKFCDGFLHPEDGYCCHGVYRLVFFKLLPLRPLPPIQPGAVQPMYGRVPPPQQAPPYR